MSLPMARDEMERRLTQALGPELAGALMSEIRPTDLDWSQVATKQDIRELRDELRADLQRFATKDDLERFATKDDLASFATKDDLTGFATKEDLERYATKDDLRTEIRVSQAEMIAAMHEAIGTAVLGQTRTMLFTLLGTALSFAAIMFTAVQVA